MTTATIEVFEDEGGSWRWGLDLGNGKRFAVSGESFDSKGNALRAAGRLAELLTDDAPVDELVIELRPRDLPVAGDPGS